MRPRCEKVLCAELDTSSLSRRMGRLLDFPTAVDPAEAQRTTRFADPSVPWPQSPCSHTSPSASSALPRDACRASVAVLVAGEFRDFLQPYRPGDLHWRNLSAASVWRRLYETVVVPNGPADLFVHSWTSQLAQQLVAEVRPCASVCEGYDREYVERILVRHQGFRLIRGFLRFNNSRETPHIVDFFFKRYAALQLMEAFEQRRGQAYRAVVLTRPDVVVLSRLIALPSRLKPSTVYVHNSDHHHDSTDMDTTADPIDRALCGQMPNDWFAYGDRASMGTYLRAFIELPQLHAQMRETRGSCDWWRCHNYRYNFTFLNNAEAYLGFHLRRSGLRCSELRAARPAVHMALPPTRRRDWGDWRDWGPGRTVS